MIVVSVNCEIGTGNDNFPTATNSVFSLYNPTLVTYGVKYDAVTNG